MEQIPHLTDVGLLYFQKATGALVTRYKLVKKGVLRWRAGRFSDD